MHNNTASKKHKHLSLLLKPSGDGAHHALLLQDEMFFFCCKQVQAHNLHWMYEVSEHLSVKREASRGLKDFTILKLRACVKKKGGEDKHQSSENTGN